MRRFGEIKIYFLFRTRFRARDRKGNFPARVAVRTPALSLLFCLCYHRLVIVIILVDCMASPKHKCLYMNDVFASCRSPDCSLYQWIGVCCCVVLCCVVLYCIVVCRT